MTNIKSYAISTIVQEGVTGIGIILLLVGRFGSVMDMEHRILV
jgi:hypothetical protein